MCKNLHTPYPLKYLIILVSLLSLGLFLGNKCLGAEILEYFNTGDTGGSPMLRSFQYGQTFQAISNHSIESVRIKAQKNNFPEDCKISFWSVINDLPEGVIFEEGFDCNIFTTPYTWEEIPLSNIINVVANTKYAVVFKIDDGFTQTSTLVWSFNNWDNDYGSGSLVYYDDGEWSTGTEDYMFEIWGTEEEATTSMPNCTTTLIEITNTTTGASFWIDKSISYGDLLITIFLCIFLIFGAIKFLTDLEIPKRMNFKK